ncbi:MAG TPA: MBL fold metallo-hydrolase [Acidobacteriota bacterium]|nr:MBL fold metallo-hydrolase [Acidobacteriota bacterium]
MRVCVLGSGSSGNCTYVETRRTRLLIDNGFGPRSLRRRLQEAGLPIDHFDALLITHGHIDHWKGAEAFVRVYQAPVYANVGTRNEVAELQQIDRWEEFRTGEPFVVGDVEVDPFPVLHDAADPVGFRLRAAGLAGAVATDLGSLTEAVEERLSACDWLILESNHDEELLRLGPYPWSLKQRLTSRLGHLSNRAFAGFLSRFDGQARHVFLAHLSRNNNDPDIALDTARQGLNRRSTGTFHDLWNPIQLHLTHQSRPTPVVEL